MVIVDTSVWVDYLQGKLTAETEWLDKEADRKRLGLVDLILCEVLQGVRSEREFSEVRAELRKFALFETGGEELCVASAQNYKSLRQQGHTVRKTIDCLIATFCIRQGHSLLHRDNDFRHFEELLGLSVIHTQRPRFHDTHTFDQ